MEYREIATKMFLPENQYQLARKLSAKNSKGYSLSTIWVNNITRWCDKFISRNSQKAI